MDKKELRFNSDGHFRILMVSDFHAGKNYDPKLKKGLDVLIRESNPDFVMIGGDQCLDRDNETELRDYFCDIIEPILERGIPWAAIFGNHDHEVGMDVETEQKVYESIPFCYSIRGPKNLHGISNFQIPVLSSESDSVSFNIFSLDSNRYISDYPKMMSLDENTRFILPNHFNDGNNGAAPLFDQIRWYFETSEKLEEENGKKIPAVMFMHIPLPEYLLVYRNPEECFARGSKRESIGATELNTGLFAACLQRGDMKGIFFGHEHLIDLQGEYCGITLACDAALGYNMSCHDDLRGGRVIDLYEDGKMQTHSLKLIDLMGIDAMRDPGYFEGGCTYFIRNL